MQKYLLGLALIYVSILVHELAHYYAARACGVRVRKFLLGVWPWVTVWRSGRRAHLHIRVRAQRLHRAGATAWSRVSITRGVRPDFVARFGFLPVGGGVELHKEDEAAASWRTRFAISAAGPAASLCLGGGGIAAVVLLDPRGTVAAAIGAFFGAIAISPYLLALSVRSFARSIGHTGTAAIHGTFTGIGEIGAQMTSVQDALIYLGLINLIIGWFNLIPLPPLDGGAMVDAVTRRLWGKRFLDLPYVGKAVMVVAVVFILANLAVALVGLVKDAVALARALM